MEEERKYEQQECDTVAETEKRDASVCPDEAAESAPEIEAAETAPSPKALDTQDADQEQGAECAVSENAACEARGQSDADEPDVTQAEPVSLGEPAPAAPDWSFGKSEAPVQKGSIRTFFSIFAAVFGVCVLLLVVTLFLGDGIKIIRQLQTERIVYVKDDTEGSGLLTRQEAADVVRRSTVSVSVKSDTVSGIGSGFIYRADGYIITNHHVIQSGGDVQVILSDGRVFDGTVVGSNADADVAVIKVEATDLPAATCGVSADLLVGDNVLAIGTPAKLDYAGSATFGTVSATRRIVQITDSEGTITKKMTLIQTDTLVNNGNSGGPLADMYGRVVGVVVLKLASFGGNSFDGINFALPIDGVRVIADAIIETGSFTGDNPIAEKRSLVGVSGYGCVGGKWYYLDPVSSKVTASDTEQFGYTYCEKSGIYVSVVSGANAQGRLREGDIITKANGLQMQTITDLIGEVNRHYAGETVVLEVWRDGRYVTVELVLSEEGAS